MLRFDIPYLVHKSIKYDIKLDIQTKRLVDLFWFIPAWLDNTDSGHKFAESYDIGKILSLNKVEKYILNKPINPISHDEYFRLYEAEKYDKIIEKLRVDLLSTYELLSSSQIEDTFGWIQNAKIDPEKCIRTCPFRLMHSVTQELSQGFCPLVSKTVSNQVKFRTIDVIGGQHFPEKDTQFKARCLR